MSWAAERKTSRREDRAYCLLGLFRVNMPLLYGEGFGAFRRLQEEILAKGDDNSLFVWGLDSPADDQVIGYESILAPSPKAFRGCGEIVKGFATQRILFEKISRGMMILIHRSYDRGTLNALLQWLSDTVQDDFNAPLGLTLPLGCGQRQLNEQNRSVEAVEPLFLSLVLDRGKWRRVGVIRGENELSMVNYQGNHYFAYTNDYVRIYVYHDRPDQRLSTYENAILLPRQSMIHYLNLRDAYEV